MMELVNCECELLVDYESDFFDHIVVQLENKNRLACLLGCVCLLLGLICERDSLLLRFLLVIRR